MQQASGEGGLWVQQATAIIHADTHDIWNLTPEFLSEEEIVPENWVCTRTARSQEQVTIEYEAIRWSGNERDLWIMALPGRPIDSTIRRTTYIVPEMVVRYLDRVPYLPVKKLWFHWILSAVGPRPEGWMQATFLPRGLPADLALTNLQSYVVFHVEGIEFQVRVRDESSVYGDDSNSNSVHFRVLRNGIGRRTKSRGYCLRGRSLGRQTRNRGESNRPSVGRIRARMTSQTRVRRRGIQYHFAQRSVAQVPSPGEWQPLTGGRPLHNLAQGANAIPESPTLHSAVASGGAPVVDVPGGPSSLPRNHEKMLTATGRVQELRAALQWLFGSEETPTHWHTQPASDYRRTWDSIHETAHQVLVTNLLTTSPSGRHDPDELAGQLQMLPAEEEVSTVLSQLETDDLRDFANGVMNVAVSAARRDGTDLEAVRELNNWFATAEEIVAVGDDYEEIYGDDNQ